MVLNPFLVNANIALHKVKVIAPETCIKLVISDIHSVHFPVCIAQNLGHKAVANESIYAEYQ